MVDSPDLHPMAEAAIQAHAVTAPIDAAVSHAHLVDMLETFEQDIYPLVAPFVQNTIDNPATPDHVKALLAPLADPQHFGESVVIGIAVGAILSPVLQGVLDPLLTSLAQGAWEVALASSTSQAGRALSPDLLAALALKSVISESAGADQAIKSGIDRPNFALMVQGAGQSMGFAEALTLANRGELGSLTLDDVLAYSNVNPKFYQALQKLAAVWPSMNEALTGRLKGHRTDAEALALFNAAGGRTEDYAWMLASLGRPPGTMEMLDLWNKSAAGLIATSVTEADVAAAVRQSDINDTFLPEVLELRHYFPPPRSVVPMLRSGAITPQQATQLLTGYGVGEPWLSAFITEGQHTAVGKAKELTQAQIMSVYEARLITRPVAQTRLEALKLPAADVTLLLDLADEKRVIALQNAGARAVGTKYVAHKMTKPQAATALASLNVPSAAQTDLFTVWDVERGINFHALTPAMIVGAFRRGQITAADTQTRLLQGGVADSDLAIVVADGFAPTKPNPAAVLAVVEGANSYIGDIGVSQGGGLTKNLTVVQVGALYASGTIGRAETLTDLGKLGYNAAQAAQLITTFNQPAAPKP